jgi:hypothetical protein
MRIPSSMRSDAYADLVSASPVDKAPFFAEESNHLSGSSAKSGSLTTSFIKAVGAGIAGAFILYGTWLIWCFIMHPH